MKVARSLSRCGFRPKSRRNHNLTIPLERYVEQMEIRLVDRQNKYERYHDAIFNNLKSDVRNLRNTADLFLESASKRDVTQELQNKVHVMATNLSSIESRIQDMDEVSELKQKAYDQIPAVIDAKISQSESSMGKEILLLKEIISTLRDEKKKEIGTLKVEISALREEMKNDVIALKAEIKGARSEYKADLRASMSMMYYRLLIGVFSAAAMGIAAIQSLGSLTKFDHDEKNNDRNTSDASPSLS